MIPDISAGRQQRRFHECGQRYLSSIYSDLKVFAILRFHCSSSETNAAKESVQHRPQQDNLRGRLAEQDQELLWLTVLEKDVNHASEAD